MRLSCHRSKYREKANVSMSDFISYVTKGAEVTYQKMLNENLSLGDHTETITGIINVREVTALIGFNGEMVGSMLISMSEDSAQKSISKFLGYEVTEVDDDVLDGVEEIVNIIAGIAAARFPKKTGLGLPTVLVGEKQRIHGSADTPWVLTTMKTENLGEFTIGVTLKEA
jgi:chemotaxis protein CheX